MSRARREKKKKLLTGTHDYARRKSGGRVGSGLGTGLRAGGGAGSVGRNRAMERSVFYRPEWAAGYWRGPLRSRRRSIVISAWSEDRLRGAWLRWCKRRVEHVGLARDFNWGLVQPMCTSCTPASPFVRAGKAQPRCSFLGRARGQGCPGGEVGDGQCVEGNWMDRLRGSWYRAADGPHAGLQAPPHKRFIGNR